MVIAQSAGWKTSGVELSKSVTQFARDERHLDVFTGTVEQAAYPEGYFDAVTLWDVIEHLDDPISTLAEIHRIMAPAGILVVFYAQSGKSPDHRWPNPLQVVPKPMETSYGTLLRYPSQFLFSPTRAHQPLEEKRV
jgi:SAM-dependent methyltransferase